MDRVLGLPLGGLAREIGPDVVFQRGSRLRGHAYGGRDGQDQRPAIRHGRAQRSLQTANKPERNPIEPQARLGEAAPVGDPLLCCRDLDGNSLPGDREIGVGRSFALFPGGREMPGNSLKGGPLALPQSAHASLPMQSAADGRRLCLRVTDFKAPSAASHRRRSSALWSLLRADGASGRSHRRVQCHRGANERLQRLFINLVAFMDIDGAPDVAFEAGVEEA